MTALSTIPALVRTPSRRPTATGAAAAVLATLVVALAVVYPFLPGYDPLGQDLAGALAVPFHSAAHPLGTDELGRDLLSRLALATRTSLLVVLAALTLNVLVGTVLGLVAAFVGGPVERLVVALADLQLSFPLMILLVTVVGVLGPSTLVVVLVLGLAYWMGYARLARAIVLSLRERQFVLASSTFGAGPLWVMRTHLVPAVVPLVAIMAAFDVGVLVVLESSLSYLGLGIRPPTPTLGGLIAEGQQYVADQPWLALLPGAALFLVVASAQLASRRFTHESGG